jgi:hypothetical protein
MSQQCPHCRLAVQDGDTFCGECGGVLVLRLPGGRAGPAPAAAGATQAPVTQAGVAVGLPAVESARRAEKVDYQEMSDEPVFDPLRNARTAAIFMSA